MKSKKRFYIATAVLLVAALCGTAVAFMIKESGSRTNTFEPAVVSCWVYEEFDSDDNNTKTSITVKNTGNIDAFIRVRIVSYWVEKDGKIVAKPSEPVLLETDTNNWIADTDNQTYYCIKPVKAEESTVNMLNSDYTLQTEGDYRKVVEVFAEAIQSNPKDAVHQAWPYVEVDSNGNLKKAI